MARRCHSLCGHASEYPRPGRPRSLDADHQWHDYLCAAHQRSVVREVHPAFERRLQFQFDRPHQRRHDDQTGHRLLDRDAKHEIGNALGFEHEQNRTDRDSFVRIFWSNLESVGFDDQFVKADGTTLRNVGPYDFGSIMHYPLIVGGVVVMEPLVTVPAGVTIGQRSALSSGDINATNILYGVRVSPQTLNVPAPAAPSRSPSWRRPTASGWPRIRPIGSPWDQCSPAQAPAPSS
ncbi:MAG: hypothetical protein FJW31_28840 [Acidobacteria bacterium]|nr:hypothetical protein [Acidobacteriota bacterium]